MYTPKMVIERVTLLRMHGGCIIIKSYDSMSVGIPSSKQLRALAYFRLAKRDIDDFHSRGSQHIWRGVDCKTWMVRVMKLVHANR